MKKFLAAFGLIAALLFTPVIGQNHAVAAVTHSIVKGETLTDYQQLVAAVNERATFTLDTHGNIRSCTNGMTTLNGYSADELKGTNFSVFYTEADQDNRLPELALKQTAARGHFQDAGWRVKKDGTKYMAEMAMSSIVVDGQLMGFNSLLRVK